MRPVAEVAGVRVLDDEVDELSPPRLDASSHVPALSMNISGVSIDHWPVETERKRMARACTVSLRQSG